MSLSDRIGPLCDLLLGAAYADDEFKDREREEVRGLLEDLGGLDKDVEARIAAFDPKKHDVAQAAAAFKGDPEDDRRRVLFLVAAINDSDDEVDFAEDDYLRAVAAALGLPASAVAGLTIDVELDEKQEAFEKVKKGPPPPPKKK
jgi:uncharacterized membrane protein YebE (DUF533 family)